MNRFITVDEERDEIYTRNDSGLDLDDLSMDEYLIQQYEEEEFNQMRYGRD